MIIEFKMDADGGFWAMNHMTKHVEYAYPTSHYAKLAKRKPEAAASQMMASEYLARTLRGYEEHNAYLRSRMRAA